MEYYNKLPPSPNVDICYVLDPIVATGKGCVMVLACGMTVLQLGNTAVATINILKEWGLSGENIKFVGVLAVSGMILYA